MVTGGREGGRKKKVPALDVLVSDLLGKEPESEGASPMEKIIKKLIARAEKGDVVCAKLLLEYTYGKPVQTIKAEVENKVTTYTLPDGQIIEV